MKHAPLLSFAAIVALTLTTTAVAQDAEASGRKTTEPQGAAPAAGDELAAAREQLSTGHPKRAVEMLETLLEQAGQPGSTGASERDVRLLLTEAQIAAGDADQAKDTITSLVDGGDATVLLAAGRAYKAWADQMQRENANGDDVGFAFDEARSYLEQASKKAARGDSAAAIELGNLELYTLGDHVAALGRADTLLAGDSKDAEARLLRGCALVWTSIDAANGGDEERAGKLRKEAIADLLAAEKALPKTRPEPWAQLAWLYEADGQQEQAVDAAVQALKRAPQGGVGTLFHLALRYSSERRYAIAAAALAAMVKADAAQVSSLLRNEQDPTASALLLGYAVGPIVEANALDEARAALAAIVAAKPQSADPWNNYAFVCRETQKYEESYDAYVQALSFDPESPRLNNDAGVILHYYLHRETDKAQAYYEKAVELADAALAQKDLDEAARADLQLAKDDAIGNLKKLAKGHNTWP